MLRAGMLHQPDNISAGTQVVSRVEVRGTNNSLGHLPRAVGVVTRRKHAMHLLCRVPVRKDLTGAATLREARVPVRVAAHRDRLLAVKRGELPWAEVGGRASAPWRKELHRDFERAVTETKLPERPDDEATNRFLIKGRRVMATTEGKWIMGATREDFMKYPRTPHLFGSKGTDDEKHFGRKESEAFIADPSGRTTCESA
jgi:hypothetical protein